MITIMLEKWEKKEKKMSYKVIKITADSIYLGDENGNFTVTPRDKVADYSFKVGDIVDYYYGEEGVLIVPVLVNESSRKPQVKKSRKGIIVSICVVCSVFLGLFIVYGLVNQMNNSISHTSRSSEADYDTVSDEIDYDKSNYIDADYEKWNHDKLAEYTKVKISGKVIQEQEATDSYILRVNKDDDYNQIVYVEIDKAHYEKVIAEDDIITIYGLAIGRTTYETIFHSTKTLPYMQGLMYDIHSGETEEDFTVRELYNQNGLRLEQVKNGTLRFYNNTGQTIKVRPESIDVDGQKINSYSLDLYDDLQPGQFMDGELSDREDIMKAGKTINISLKIMNDSYDDIGQINVSILLEKDIVNW